VNKKGAFTVFGFVVAVKLSGTERTQLFSGELTQPDYFHQVLIDSGSLIVAAR
jgi:hypothetical protein